MVKPPPWSVGLLERQCHICGLGFGTAVTVRISDAHKKCNRISMGYIDHID